MLSFTNSCTYSAQAANLNWEQLHSETVNNSNSIQATKRLQAD